MLSNHRIAVGDRLGNYAESWRGRDLPFWVEFFPRSFLYTSYAIRVIRSGSPALATRRIVPWP